MSILSNIASSLCNATQRQSATYGDPSDSIAQVISNLDADGKGYLDVSDFQAAFESLGLGSADTADGSLTRAGAQEVVSILDVDGDGRVTSDDMTQGLQSLTDSLGVLRGRESQAGTEALGAMLPPPPTSGQGLGFTKDELTAQLESLTATDGADTQDEGTQLLANILDQFDAVDTDGDGRISGEEALSFAQSLQNAGSAVGDASAVSAGATVQGAAASTSAANAATSASAEQLAMRRIMALVGAYRTSDVLGDSGSDLVSELA